MSTEHGHATEVQHEPGTSGINLMDGESVLQNRRPGWGLWWKHLLGAVLVVLIGLGGGADTLPGAVLIAGILVGYVAIARSKSRYIVTDERVKMDIGLIRSESREYRISDVQGIDTSQSFIAKLFGIGDIGVRTADGTEIPWRGVPDHKAVAQTIREHQRQYDETMDRK